MMLSMKAPKSICFSKRLSPNLPKSHLIFDNLPLFTHIFLLMSLSHYLTKLSLHFEHAQLTKPTFCRQCTLQNLTNLTFHQRYLVLPRLLGAIPLTNLNLELILEAMPPNVHLIVDYVTPSPRSKSHLIVHYLEPCPHQT
jgi:hypothetical protein